jgi:hypothetical protein
MLPEDWSDAEIDAEFRAAVEHAMAWAVTDNRRDQVMNALYDVLVGLGPYDGEEPEQMAGHTLSGTPKAP